LTDDRSKRRAGLLADSEVIDGVERGSDPDVQVLDLGDTPDDAPKAPPERQGWIEGVRTTLWEGREARGEVPPALQRSKQVTGSIEVEVEVKRPSPGRPRRTSPDPRRPATASPDPRRPATASPDPRRPATASPAPQRPVTASPAPRRPATASPAPQRPVTTSPAPRRPATASPESRRPATAKKAGPAIEARRTAPFAKIELKHTPRTERQPPPAPAAKPAGLEAKPTELKATPAQLEARPARLGTRPAELEAKTGRYPRSRVERPITSGGVTSAPVAPERQIVPVPVGADSGRPGLREAAEELDLYDDRHDDGYVDGYDDGYVDHTDAEEEPAIGGVPQLEAPSKIKVQNVERISPDPRLRVITYPDSAAAEQYRVLALKIKEGRAIRRVVAVMAPTTESAGPITAANIALALAEGRRSRIMMLDADLRGGELGALFDLSQGPGLAEQIRNHRRQPEQPWIALELTRSLHFLHAGTSENPASLLNSEALGDLMAELRRAYDFIIMATPPVIESADVNILQEHVDGAVLVVKAGVTKKDTVAASITRLGGKKFLGAVLVGVKG
jgi:Mrp family chromosome partitioning ATPase